MITLKEFKATVLELVSKKLEEKGDQNPCKGMAATDLDSDNVSGTCQQAYIGTRHDAATYVLKALVEKSARMMNSTYDSQSRAADKELLAFIKDNSSTSSYSTGIVNRVVGSSAQTFLRDMQDGKNLMCVGKNNVCDRIEAKVTAKRADTAAEVIVQELKAPRFANNKIIAANLFQLQADVKTWVDDATHQLATPLKAPTPTPTPPPAQQQQQPPPPPVVEKKEEPVKKEEAKKEKKAEPKKEAPAADKKKPSAPRAPRGNGGFSDNPSDWLKSNK